MSDNMENLNALEIAIVEYLAKRGPAGYLAISADLDLEPTAVFKTLVNLQGQGRVRVSRYTDLLYEIRHR